MSSDLMWLAAAQIAPDWTTRGVALIAAAWAGLLVSRTVP